jgi:hypothetical protein
MNSESVLSEDLFWYPGVLNIGRCANAWRVRAWLTDWQLIEWFSWLKEEEKLLYELGTLRAEVS